MNCPNSEDKLILDAILYGSLEIVFIIYVTYLIWKEKKKL